MAHQPRRQTDVPTTCIPGRATAAAKEVVSTVDRSGLETAGALVPGAGAGAGAASGRAPGLQRDIAQLREDLMAELAKLSTSQEEIHSRVVEVLEVAADSVQLQALRDKVQEVAAKLDEAAGRNAAVFPFAGASAGGGANFWSESESAGCLDGPGVAADLDGVATGPQISRRQSAVMETPEDDQKHVLKIMFMESEAEEMRQQQLINARKHRWQHAQQVMREMKPAQVEAALDFVTFFFIMANALWIGISMDLGDGNAVAMLVDVIFSIFFTFEILFKLHLHGCAKHFCGPSKVSNWFDACLITNDTIQTLVLAIFPEIAQDTSGLAMGSLFRVVRILRLARLVRLLKHEVFKNLLSMIHGMMGGMTTLMWSLMLFTLVIYTTALFFREALGRAKHENVYEFFNSVPRSMFTTFRCSFGDCSTHGGQPIFEFVNDTYGPLASMFYCLFVFCISVGLFNVISAIFVESTMDAAARMQQQRKKDRLSDTLLWDSRISTLIKLILQVGKHRIPGYLSESVDDIHSLEFGHEVLDEVVKDGVAQQMLDDLDIDSDDHARLSDILDPDNGGTFNICDFIDGVRSLRGDPRRSDIICVDLMIRSLQKTVAAMDVKVDEIQERMLDLRKQIRTSRASTLQGASLARAASKPPLNDAAGTTAVGHAGAQVEPPKAVKDPGASVASTHTPASTNTPPSSNRPGSGSDRQRAEAQKAANDRGASGAGSVVSHKSMQSIQAGGLSSLGSLLTRADSRNGSGNGGDLKTARRAGGGGSGGGAASLTVILVDQRSDELRLKCGLHEPLQELMDMYCKKMGKQPADLRFSFLGRDISPAATAREINLDNEDVIDVFASEA